LVLAGHAFDEVWPACIRLFMTQNMKGFKWNGPPVVPDLPSKTMSGGWMMGKGIAKWNCGMSLLFEEKGGSLQIFATAHGENVGKKNAEKAEKKFFDDLITALYGSIK
jgi:hypothetical protein